ncbi:hypothetical protein AB0E27_31550 [Streptomyces sparsogenes]|uniref:hypothetical protein n=1 Tax=Streptomyces sparsogenes TaxID=67365 RepID=UPI0033CAA9C6
MPTTYYPYSNGTVGPTGPQGPQGPPGPAGANGVVQSVNGQSSKDVVLTAAHVNALPSKANAQLDAQYLWLNTDAGIYRAFGWKSAGVDRWLMQVDDVAETGSAAGSNFRLSARNDDGSFNKTAIFITRSGGQTAFLTTSVHGSAAITAGGAIGLRDITADPATASGGVFLYSKNGVPFFRNADGASFQVQPVSYPVTSVNGEVGNVNLGAADVGALDTATGGTVNGAVKISGAAGSYRTFGLATGGVNRWNIEADNTAEPGDGSGSDLVITSRTDTGDVGKHAIHVKRSTGQTSFGVTAPLGEAQVTSGGAFGLRDLAADPTDAAGGVQLYSKAGLPYIKQGDGSVFQVGVGGGAGGAVQSVNGKTGIVELGAEDVGAVPASGGTVDNELSINAVAGTDRGSLLLKKQGLTRWVAAVTDSPESGSGEGSDFGIARYDDAGNEMGYVILARRSTGSVGIGTTSLMAGSKLTVGGDALGLRNLDADPATSTAGAQLYAKGGLLYARQADGTVFQVQPAGAGSVSSINGMTGAVVLDYEDVGALAATARGTANGVASLDSSSKVPVAQLPDAAVPSSFTPEILGLKAWAGDPAYCASGSSYTGVGTGRMSAVYINRTMTVSKIVWHFFGYAGGLLSGSWAAIYDTSGARKGFTGDMSTAAYEPAEQHQAGGGWSSSPLTSAVTLSPGVYYVLWRFNYTASPVDGPALARFESASTCQSVMGVNNNVWRHASYTLTNTTAPSSIAVGNFERDPIRFWVALT